MEKTALVGQQVLKSREKALPQRVRMLPPEGGDGEGGLAPSPPLRLRRRAAGGAESGAAKRYPRGCEHHRQPSKSKLRKARVLVTYALSQVS